MHSFVVNSLRFEKAGKRLISVDELALPDSGIVFILGVNGSGKTSFLRCLARLEKYRGNIELFDRSLQDYGIKEIAQKVAWIPSEFRPSFSLSVKRVLLLGAFPKNNGIPSISDERLAEKLCEDFGIASLIERDVNSLSSGELQKVQIIRGLMSGAHILLLDEPCAHLDPKSRHEVLESLRKHCKLALLVSHDYMIYKSWADYTLLFEDNKFYQFKSGRLSDQELKKFYGIDSSY